MKITKESRAFSLVLIMLGFTACMEIRAVDRAHEVTQKVDAQAGSSLSQWETQSTGSFNEYRVILKNVSEGILQVERELVTEGVPTKALPLQLGVFQGRAMDTQVEGGKTYRYHWVDSGTGQRVPGKSILVKVPLDLKIESEITPESDLGKVIFSAEKIRPVYGTIVFSEKGSLTTNGHDLVIEADSIQGEKVVIRTFDPANQAKDKKDKVNGGQITVTANKAVGDFHFELSGRQGLRGVEGKKPGPELMGRQGVQGKSGHKMPGSDDYCGLQPGNGGPGHQGATGYPGGPGEQGGDTAVLRLKILDGSQFQWTFRAEVGKGGEGGLGGEGGAGGPGGPAGKPGYPCTAQPGPAGPPGDRGRHGDWGVPGKISPIFEWRDGQMVEIRRGDEES
ncbi:MAG: hypothetical protein KF789_13035 [Bdellovibrionaceae bacterium]|nr:hypothetical protein [Pseudobdellovibrionaceae bacterium]